MFGLFRQKPDPIVLFEAFVAAISHEWDTANRSSIPFMGIGIEAVAIKQLEANNFKASREQFYHVRSCAMVVEISQTELRKDLDNLVSSARTGDKLQREICCINIFEELRLQGMPVKYFGDKRGIVEINTF